VSADDLIQLHWSTAARRWLLPRRGSDTSSRKVERQTGKRSRVELRGLLFEERRKTCEECLRSSVLTRDFDETSRGWVAVMQARWLDTTAAAEPLVPEHEGLVWYFWNHVWHADGAHRRLPALWLQAEDPAFLVRAAASARALKLAIRARRSQPPDAWLTDREVEAFAQLREALSVAPEGEYARARQAAAEVWETADHVLRCALAFAFPESRDWGNQALEGCLGRSASRETGNALVVGSGADPAGLRRLVIQEMYPSTLARYALDFADYNGGEALPGLTALYQRVHAHAYQRSLSLALSVFECAQVAELFVERLDDWKTQPRVELEYLQRSPILARAALVDRSGQRIEAVRQGLAQP